MTGRAENKACARRLAAIFELHRRRQMPDEHAPGRELWRIDAYEAVAAEVAAAQGITAAAACAQLHNAVCLHERLPNVAALFATGALSYRIVQMIVTLAHTVCAGDPRTLDQRRADAIGALAAGHTTLIRACAQPHCTAPEHPTTTSVIVHVVAEAAALDGATSTDLHGQRPGDDGPEIVRDPQRFAELIGEATRARPSAPPRTAPRRPAPTPGVVFGGPLIPAAIVSDLAARGAAQIRPVIHPRDSPPEPRYRPSAALADSSAAAT